MSKTIQHKRSSVSGNKPNNTQVEVGELGINFSDRSIYTKDGSNVITELARDIWRSDVAPDSALDGDLWYNTSNGTISIWDDSEWGEITSSGKPVNPENITSDPPFESGSGTVDDPYVLSPAYANVGDVDVHIGTFTITDLNEGQIVNSVDNNSADNEGKFKSTNNIAGPGGILTFRAYFDDAPESSEATSYVGEFKIGNIYVNSTVVIAEPLEGGTEIPDGVPDGVGGNGPFIWEGSSRTLTATYPLLISSDGAFFTDQITVENGDDFWLKWAGDPGSGLGIDNEHGTTISGAVTDGVGGAKFCYFTVDKETSFVFHNFVDSDQTIGGQSESRVVTVRDVNSYVYPFGTTTGDSAQYAKNGGDWTDMPSTNDGSATDYLIEGDEFQLRHRDAATINTASTYNFNMAGDSADWTTVTADVLPVIKQPEIETPLEGATGISTTGPFVSSDFEMASGTDTHTASSWQIVSEGWSKQSSLQDQVGSYDMKAVAWDGSQFCAVGAYARCGTSPDGVTWTNQPGLDGASSLDKNDIVWDGAQFCTVGQNGKCATSPDGVTWTNQPGLASATSSRIYMGIAWDGSQFCAVADQAAATSPDGITWTSQSGLYSTMGTSSYAITWGNNLFVVVGQSGKCATSPDGVTWTKPSTPTSEKLWGITWSGTQFCAVGRNAVCITSPDGVVWTSQPNLASVAPGIQFNSIDWDGSQFCAVGANGTAATSPDGVVWTIQPSFNQASNNQVMNGIVSGGGQFVSVGNTSACATFSKTVEASLDSDTSALISWELDSALDYGQDYKVRVKHHTASLNSEWSDYRSFETKENILGASWDEASYAPSGATYLASYAELQDGSMIFVEKNLAKVIKLDADLSTVSVETPSGFVTPDRYIIPTQMIQDKHNSLAFFGHNTKLGVYTANEGETWTSTQTLDNISASITDWAIDVDYNQAVTCGYYGTISYSEAGRDNGVTNRRYTSRQFLTTSHHMNSVAVGTLDNGHDRTWVVVGQSGQIMWAHDNASNFSNSNYHDAFTGTTSFSSEKLLVAFGEDKDGTKCFRILSEGTNRATTANGGVSRGFNCMISYDGENWVEDPDWKHPNYTDGKANDFGCDGGKLWWWIFQVRNKAAGQYNNQVIYTTDGGLIWRQTGQDKLISAPEGEIGIITNPAIGTTKYASLLGWSDFHKKLVVVNTSDKKIMLTG